MILVDLSQIAIGAGMASKNADIDMLRHMILNQISSIKTKFKKVSDEVVLCVDQGPYWRKKIFPNYKANRDKGKEDSSFDWDDFFKSFNKLKVEFAENLPYKVVTVPGAEADDIIAILAQLYAPHKNVIIVSRDTDFVQLQSHLKLKIKQYDQVTKKYVTPESTKYDLFEHIVKGDGGDGIPNIFSDDDVFLVEGKRQKAVRATSLAAWRKHFDEPENFCESVEQVAKYRRNQTIVDLTKIPLDIVEQIKYNYDNAKSNKHATFNYLIKHKLRRLLEDGGL